jgi:AraC-like DNA-binding protein
MRGNKVVQVTSPRGPNNYGPKLFQSVLRFQRLLNLTGCASAPGSLAQFYAEAGYADQAHMTREVQRFSGMPPTVLLRTALCDCLIFSRRPAATVEVRCPIHSRHNSAQRSIFMMVMTRRQNLPSPG